MDRQQRIMHLLADPGDFDLTSQVENLVSHQVSNGREVRVLLLGQQSACQRALREHGAATRLIHNRWSLDPFAIGCWAQELHSWQPNVVHLWGSAAVQLVRVARWVDRRLQVIATLHGFSEPSRWLGMQTFAGVDRLVVDSQFAAVQYVEQGVRTEHLQVIPPGALIAADSSAQADRSELLQRLAMPSEARVIVVGGSLTRNQSLDEAIWYFELVRTLHNQTRLLVVGDGPHRAQLQRYARLVSEPRAIRFCSQTALNNGTLACGDIYWQVGGAQQTPTLMLAAMAAGIPVVAADTPVMREVVEHGVSGLLVPGASRAGFARQTDRLISDAELHRQLAAEGSLVVARRFSREQMQAAYDSAYDQLRRSRAVMPTAR